MFPGKNVIFLHCFEIEKMSFSNDDWKKRFFSKFENISNIFWLHWSSLKDCFNFDHEISNIKT